MITVIIMIIMMTQVNLAHTGMGLASVEQQWSFLLPNLLVKDQVLLILTFEFP